MQYGGKNFNYFPENQLTKFCASTGVTDPIASTSIHLLNLITVFRCGARGAVRLKDDGPTGQTTGQCGRPVVSPSSNITRP